MITAIEIENFKAFGERQRIELRPITLLFGPNSGGKSSVTHALHYLREVLIHGNLDAHKTRSGGETLDLGGVRNFVHGRVSGAPIRIKCEFTLSGAELPNYLRSEAELHTDVAALLIDDDIETVKDQISSAAVELELDTTDFPIVRSWTVEINGEHFASLVFPRERPHAEVRQINWLHPCLQLSPEDRELAVLSRQIASLQSKLEEVYTAKGKHAELDALTRRKEELGNDLPGKLAGLYSAAGGTPLSDTVFSVPHAAGTVLHFGSPLSLIPEQGQSASTLACFDAILSMLLLGPGAVCCNHLKEFRYVGPLRAIPPRHVEPREQTGRSRWSSGLRAWELLAHGQYFPPVQAYGEGTLIEEVSKWLEGEDRLNTGYRLEREVFKQVPSSIATMVSDPEYIDRLDVLAGTIKSLPDYARVMLRDVGRNLLLQPQDVGVGLSQIVPVIVALLDPGSPLVALEQPELHLHPRQQAALGDALIKGTAIRPNRVLLVETHSEHVILRLLRRIRESTLGEATRDTSLRPHQVSVAYVQPNGRNSVVTAIPVSEEGDFTRAWPNGFFAERVEELL